MDYRKIIFLSVTFCALVLVCRGQAPVCTEASKFYAKDSLNITTFGASTVAGVGGFSFQADVQNNIESCYTGVIVTITNNGVSGQTTTQGLPRFPGAIAGRTGFVLILMGADDALALADGQGKVSDTENNMRYYIQTALKNNLIPIIGTVQFFNDKNNQRFKTANLYVTQINNGYRQLVQQYHIYLADINRAIGRDFSLYQDYVHPNATGDKLISYVWFDAINRAVQDKLLQVALNQNFPNPAIDRTSISFSLSQAGQVTIKIYSIYGRYIETVYDAYENAGARVISIPLVNLDPGVYVYSMQVGGQVISKKMIVTR